MLSLDLVLHRASALSHLSEQSLFDLGDECISAVVSHALANIQSLKVDAVKISTVVTLSAPVVYAIEVPAGAVLCTVSLGCRSFALQECARMK